MVDWYPHAIQMPVPHENVFWNCNPHFAIVIHGTAGWQGASAQDIANMFATAADKRSSHFIVGKDGTVVQAVSLVDGSGANCCLESGHDPFWDIGVDNLNTVTVSIEHVKWATDNSDALTPAQQQASFQLIKWLCDTLGIDSSHIKSHASLDPSSRARCPGAYPWSELIAYLQGATPVQTYSAQSKDFNQWFTQKDANHWLCKKYNTTIQLGILSTYCQLSVDGQTLPVPGLPLTSELSVTLPDKAGNSQTVAVTVCERAALIWDPKHALDSQPGMSDCYLMKLNDPRLLKLIPGLQLPTATSLPPAVQKDAQAVLAAVQQLAKDAGIA